VAEVLSALDRRIIGALQIDGRAPWSTIAKALDEPLRTVSRRGGDLLASGTVRVVGLANLGPTCVIEITCQPTRLESIAEALAEHPGVVYLLVLANPSSLLVEIHEKTFDLATMTLSVIPAFEGVIEVSATPVLRYYKTNAQWMPGLLDAREVDRFELLGLPEESTGEPERLDPSDQAIVGALEEDGRVGITELATLAGLTEPTVRRRLAELRTRGAFAVRTIIAPELLGFRVEACLRIECSPAHVDTIGEMLAAVPEVRYVAQVLGQYPLVVHLNAADLPALRQLLSAGWIGDVRSLHASLVTRVLKRSGHSTSTLAETKS